MPTATVNNIDIAYDWHGAGEGPVILMIMGLGLPSTAWPPEFIGALTRAGYRVLTFDNRDAGQSALLGGGKQPNVLAQALRYQLRMAVKSPYRIADMAADAAALLGALGVDRAHVVGASMGGMIAQTMALDYPNLVRTLTSIMSTTNDRRLPKPEWPVARYMLRRPRDRSQRALRSYHEGFWPLIQSPAYPHSEQELADFLDRLFARGMSLDGAMRQVLAILAAPNRAPRLAQLTTPSLVIHGDADPLLPVECGYATAAAIRDAEIVIFEGMGHDLPQPLLPQLVDAIVGHTRVADSAPSAFGTLATEA